MALFFGDPVPIFRTPGVSNPNYAFDTAAGRYVVLGLLTAQGADAIQAARDIVAPHRTLFDDVSFCFYAMIADTPENRAAVFLGDKAAVKTAGRHVRAQDD